MLNKKISQIDFNWFSTPECGDEFLSHTVGKGEAEKKVVRIEHGTEYGQATHTHFNVFFEDGSAVGVYNINQVFWGKE